MSKRKSKWTKYIFEFLSIFLGVTLAFALSQWNERNKRYESSEKTLLEIRNGLASDIVDLRGNKTGHETGIYACHYFRKYLTEQKVDKDSVVLMFNSLLRDYISIQNKSGYESLKSKGLELVRDDSLRLEIISLYDFDYEIIEKMEEGYSESQFHENYFYTINSLLADYMVFNDQGELIQLKPPVDLSRKERNIILSYLWKIEFNRSFTRDYYMQVENKAQRLIEHIDATVK